MIYSSEINRLVGASKFGSEFEPAQEGTRSNHRTNPTAGGQRYERESTPVTQEPLSREGSAHGAHGDPPTTADLLSSMATRDDVLLPSTESCPINGEPLPFNPILFIAIIGEFK